MQARGNFTQRGSAAHAPCAPRPRLPYSCCPYDMRSSVI
jgi:hypothetical protein